MEVVLAVVVAFDDVVAVGAWCAAAFAVRDPLALAVSDHSGGLALLFPVGGESGFAVGACPLGCVFGAEGATDDSCLAASVSALLGGTWHWLPHDLYGFG